MDRRNFMKATGVLALGTLVSCKTESDEKEPELEVYELQIHTLSEKGNLLKDYLRDAYIPAMNRMGAQVGVFSSFKNEEDDRLWIVTVFKNMDHYLKCKHGIWDDEVYRADAQGFFDQTCTGTASKATEIYLMESISPDYRFIAPGQEKTLKELRIYRSPNVEGNKRKVEMFRDDEAQIFTDTDMGVAFYGKVLSGPITPTLIYMPSFVDEEVRDAKWDEFRPKYKLISGLEKYLNNMERVVSNDYLRSLEFSQF